MMSTVVIIWDQMTFKYYDTSKEVWTLFLTALIEPIIYHPMILFFSLKGYYSYITSRELAWGTMTRQGFDSDKNKEGVNTKNDSPNSDNSTSGKKFNVFNK